MAFVFSNSIRSYRKKKSITQREMIELLKSISELSNLDLVTYSRWENNKTKPNTKKIIKILFFINDNNNLHKIIQSKRNNFKFNHFTFNNGTTIMPYVDNFIHKITCRNFKLSDYESIYGSNIKSSFIFSLIECKKIKTIIFNDKYDNKIGHVSLIISDSETTFNKKSFDLNIISIHSSTLNSLMFIINIIYLLCITYRFSYITIKLYTNYIKDILLKNNGEIIEKGEICEKGIKHNYKSYKWLHLKIKTEDLLNCDFFNHNLFT